MKVLFKLILVSFILSLGACSPRVYKQLEPSGDNLFWRNGVPSHEQTIDDISVIFKIVDQSHGTMITEIEITNNSDSPVNILPSSFYYISGYYQDTDIYRVYSDNPTTEINNLENKIDEEKSDYQGTKLANSIKRAIVEEDLYKKKRYETKKEREARYRRLNDMEDEIYSDKLNHRKKMDTMAGNIQLLDQYRLKPLILNSGDNITGQVSFKKSFDGSNTVFYIPINGQKFKFNYKLKGENNENF